MQPTVIVTVGEEGGDLAADPATTLDGRRLRGRRVPAVRQGVGFGAGFGAAATGIWTSAYLRTPGTNGLL